MALSTIYDEHRAPCETISPLSGPQTSNQCSVQTSSPSIRCAEVWKPSPVIRVEFPSCFVSGLDSRSGSVGYQRSVNWAWRLSMACFIWSAAGISELFCSRHNLMKSKSRVGGLELVPELVDGLKRAIAAITLA